VTNSARAAKIESLLKVPLATCTEQLEEVRKAKHAVLKSDPKADVRQISEMESILVGVVMNLSSARAQFGSLK
jgi:hypothetical protein